MGRAQKLMPSGSSLETCRWDFAPSDPPLRDFLSTTDDFDFSRWPVALAWSGCVDVHDDGVWVEGSHDHVSPLARKEPTPHSLQDCHEAHGQLVNERADNSLNDNRKSLGGSPRRPVQVPRHTANVKELAMKTRTRGTLRKVASLLVAVVILLTGLTAVPRIWVDSVGQAAVTGAEMQVQASDTYQMTRLEFVRAFERGFRGD